MIRRCEILRGCALPLLLALSGCGGGSGAAAPTMTDFTLSVAVTGGGTVTSSPAGISCPGACTASFAAGSTVTLSAAAANSNTFSSWGGACASAATATTCAVSLSQSSSATAAFAAPASKPVLVGLVTMGDESWIDVPGEYPQNRLLEVNAHPQVYKAAVIEATWSQLEPQPQTYDDSVIDTALQAIQTYNATYPATPIVAKLRIFAGVHTPSWVLQQVGSVSIVDPNSGATVTLPQFWTSAYSQLWTQLQNHLASVYDSNPLIGEVAISVCSSITAEPFVVPGNAIPALQAAGYTAAQMQQCLSGAASDYSAWKLTPLDYTINPTLDGSSPGSTPFSTQVAEAFRQALGTRAVVANHDLNDPIASQDAQLYSEFQSLYAAAQGTAPPNVSPLEFQTAGPTVDWSTVVPFAISTYHPTEIEIWNTTAVQGGAAPITLGELQQWAGLLTSAN
jgi:hypothetical protein